MENENASCLGPKVKRRAGHGLFTLVFIAGSGAVCGMEFQCMNTPLPAKKVVVFHLRGLGTPPGSCTQRSPYSLGSLGRSGVVNKEKQS